jgi:hypothetical protein
MYTEEEIKTKWCPMIRESDMDGSSGSWNRPHLISADGKPVNHTGCLASGCMMWRWLDWTTSEGKKQGYCGLAGKE